MPQSQVYGVPQQGAYAAPTGAYVGAVPTVVMGAQPYVVETTENYVGPATICIAIVLWFVVGPFALIACCMPCDQRQVTHVVTA
jgi:hypothetical protein